MIGVILRRLLSALPILLIVSLITFGMIHLIPGDPAAAIAGLSATPEQIAAHPRTISAWTSRCCSNVALVRRPAARRSRPLAAAGPAGAAGDAAAPAGDLALSAYALVLTLVIGLISGVVAALRQNTWVDQAAMMLAMIGISLPNFYLGLLMIILFCGRSGLAADRRLHRASPTTRWAGCATSTMPAISLALLLVGLLARITRSTMLEVLRQDYIRTARAKGLPRRQVVVKHALANALIPITTVVGIIVSLLISGSVVTETLFSIPGIGQLLTQAVLNRDYPMVQGGLLIVTALLVLVNIGVDVCLRPARSARAL